MSDTCGFNPFQPGLDFLQNLSQSAGAASPLARLSGWVAPTCSIEEVDKRIAELKTVQFWIEQNARALAATIQALQVQRMTLVTLQGMQVNMGELAQAFRFPAAAAPSAPSAPPPASAPESGTHAHWPLNPPPAAAGPPPPAASQENSPAADDNGNAAAAQQAAAAGQAALQWWGALTQQFQQIALKAMAEPLAPAAAVAAVQQAAEASSAAADIAQATQAAFENMAAPLEQATQTLRTDTKPAKTAKTGSATAKTRRST